MSENQATMIIELLNSFKTDNKEEHYQIIKRLDKTNGNVSKNTEHRQRFEGGFGVIKWILGFVGIGNIVILFKLFI
jgi:hypothetical protein